VRDKGFISLTVAVLVLLFTISRLDCSDSKSTVPHSKWTDRSSSLPPTLEGRKPNTTESQDLPGTIRDGVHFRVSVKVPSGTPPECYAIWLRDDDTGATESIPLIGTGTLDIFRHSASVRACCARLPADFLSIGLLSSDYPAPATLVELRTSRVNELVCPAIDWLRLQITNYERESVGDFVYVYQVDGDRGRPLGCGSIRDGNVVLFPEVDPNGVYAVFRLLGDSKRAIFASALKPNSMGNLCSPLPVALLWVRCPTESLGEGRPKFEYAVEGVTISARWNANVARYEALVPVGTSWRLLRVGHDSSKTTLVDSGSLASDDPERNRRTWLIRLGDDDAEAGIEPQ
jgi:hypothetical protein